MIETQETFIVILNDLDDVLEHYLQLLNTKFDVVFVPTAVALPDMTTVPPSLPSLVSD